MIAPSEYREYNGTVLFFVVPGIKDMEPGVAFSCLARLNQTIARSQLSDILDMNWIGSTISGVFVLVPDELHIPVHTLLPTLFADLCTAGVPVRCGVGWGACVCFRDADGGLNFVGRPINLAARLAYSEQNEACLVSTEYEQYASGFVGAPNQLNLVQAPSKVIVGKAHDTEGFPCRTLSGSSLRTVSVPAARELHAHQEPTSSVGMVLAYDLPGFSAGDNSQLSKRVRSIVYTMRELKENHSASRMTNIYFCPGGDGGVMVLENVRQEATSLAKELAQKLVVESEYKDNSISVNARIGVHYGPVILYHDAAGRIRPTGPSCFIADELISDEVSRTSGVVFSESLRNVISHGSDKFLRSEFDELPPILGGPAAGIVRYAPKRSGRSSLVHPLIQQLFGPKSSWQPEKD